MRIYFNFLLILAFIISLSGCSDNILANLLNLQGKWHYRIGDNQIWSSPKYSDNNWSVLQIPGMCSPHSYPFVIWYRTKFKVPPDLPHSDLAIFLGTIRYADETYINGIKIGQEGKFGPDFVEADKKDRLYKIPDNLLNFDGPNILAVRINVSYLQGGISGPVLIGPQKILSELAKKRTYIQIISEIFIAGCLTVIIVFCICLFLNKMKGKEYVAFAVFIFIYTLTFILDSLLWYELKLKTAEVQALLICLYAIMPCIFIYFITSAYQYKINFMLKFISYLFFALSMLFLLLHKNLILYKYISLLWSILVVLLIFPIVHIVIKSFRTNFLNEYIPLTCGIFFLYSCAIFEQIHNFHLQFVKNADNLSHLGIFLFIISSIYALTARFVRLTRELQYFSQQIICVQEEERKKISREIHDGLCQSIIAIKLQIQLLISKVRDQQKDTYSTLKYIINEINLLVQEAKNISLHLRPMLFDRMDISMAIQTYLDRLKTISDIEIDARLESVKIPATVIAEHLYRIMQEAVSNVLRHAQATKITIILQENKNAILLAVEDNGIGFDWQQIMKQNQGIGFITMKERARILHAHLFIESKPGKGTLVEVEIPKKNFKKILTR